MRGNREGRALEKSRNLETKYLRAAARIHERLRLPPPCSPPRDFYTLCLCPNANLHCQLMFAKFAISPQILDGSFSDVSKPIFARNCAFNFCNIFQALQDLRTFANFAPESWAVLATSDFNPGNEVGSCQILLESWASRYSRRFLLGTGNTRSVFLFSSASQNFT